MRNLFNQAIRFVGLSGIGWLMDFAVYTALSYVTGNPFLSNICSSVVGASFVFVFSTRFVFQNNSRIPLVVKYCIYIAYQAVLIYFASWLLGEINAFILTYISWTIITNMSAVVSKIVVTPVTMVLNFFVMKGVIEKI